MPKLSIVIPSYARADLLAACLATVTTHAPADAEVLVIDDASAGGVICRVASSFGVRSIRLPRRGGFCVAANVGVRAASGEVVEMLNDDTEVGANWATAALRWFDDPAVASVAPLVLQLGTPLIDTAGDEYDPGGFACKRGHDLAWADAPAVLRVPGPVWGVSAAAGFYRRSALLEVGGFPADFGAYFEDVDLAHRLRRAGHAAWYEPGSVVHHHISSSYGRSPSRRTLERQSCNEERVFWRNATAAERLRRLPRHLAVLAGKAARRQVEGTLTPWITGRARAMFFAGGGHKLTR